MKITNSAQMQQALEQMARMYGAIASLKERIEAQNPQTFEVMIEGPLDEIRKLQAQIDEFLGLTGFPHSIDESEPSRDFSP